MLLPLQQNVNCVVQFFPKRADHQHNQSRHFVSLLEMYRGSNKWGKQHDGTNDQNNHLYPDAKLYIVTFSIYRIYILQMTAMHILSHCFFLSTNTKKTRNHCLHYSHTHQRWITNSVSNLLRIMDSRLTKITWTQCSINNCSTASSTPNEHLTLLATHILYCDAA